MARRPLARLLPSLLVLALVATPAAATIEAHRSAQRSARAGVFGAQAEKSAAYPELLCPGDQIAYSVTLLNVSDAGTGILLAAIVDLLPIGVSYVPGSATGGAVYDAIRRQVVWEGALAPGGSRTISFRVTVDAGAANGTVISNTAMGSLLIGEQRLEVPVAVAAVVNCPPPSLALEKASSFDGPLCPGSRIDYDIHLTNTSPRLDRLPALLEDPIPAGTTYVPGSADGGAAFLPLAIPTGGSVVWSGTLAGGESRHVSFAVTVGPGTPDGTVITNRVEGELADPSSETPIGASSQTRNTVDCVQAVAGGLPKVRQTVKLHNVEFVDDEDPWGSGELFYASWARYRGEPTKSAEVHANENVVYIDSGVTRGINQVILDQEHCCPLPDLDVVLDFWDDDGDLAELILKVLQALVGIVDPATPVGRGLEGAAAIAQALQAGGVKAGDKEDLGTFRDPALEPPSRCFLDQPVETHHPGSIRRSGGAGASNGDVWLLWDAPRPPVGTCAVVEDPVGDSASPRVDVVRFSASQDSGRELRLFWKVKTAGGASYGEALESGPPVRHQAELTAPRSKAHAPGRAAPRPRAGEVPPAYRVEATLGGGPGAVQAEVEVLRWNGLAWEPTGALPFATELGEDSFEVVLDRETLGSLSEYSVSSRLYDGDQLADRAPEDATVEQRVVWLPDVTPPVVRSARPVPSSATTGPGGVPLPFGSFARIVVEFSERVEVGPGDVAISPPLPFRIEAAHRRLEIVPQTTPGPGRYTVTLSGAIADTAGHLLDGDGDGIGGDAYTTTVEVMGGELLPGDAAGHHRSRFAVAEPIYAFGRGYPPRAPLRLYLVAEGAVVEGGNLVDRTVAGPTAATAGADGVLAPVDLSPAVAAGEYALVADVDGDGVFRSAADRRWREGGVGVAVFAAEGSCTAGPTTLCLNDGRFRVETTWETRLGTHGAGQAEPLTGDTGTFWFFQPDNVEMVVKVLDGCTVNDRFWVFAAGLTDVAVDLVVTDTATGAVAPFHNAMGTAFQPIQATAAFATCGASSVVPGGPPPALLGAWEAFAGTVEAVAAPAEILLHQGRFRVEAAWRAPQGTSGVGQSRRLTDDTGTFWFFQPDNVEMVVKVLDGCTVNDRYWVFAAGLTDVEVDLVVTDTATGAKAPFHNVMGTAFQPIQATAAFATCP